MKALGGTLVAAIAVGLAIIGCTTALAMTGHVPGDVAINTFLIVGGGAIGITGAHVGGMVATGAGTTVAPGPVVPTSTQRVTPPPAPSSPVQAA